MRRWFLHLRTNAATDGSNVLMLAMRWTASGVSATEFLCLGMHGRLRTVVPATTTPLGMDSGATWESASWDLGLATAPPNARTAPTRARLVSLQRRETRLQHSSWTSLKRLQRRRLLQRGRQLLQDCLIGASSTRRPTWLTRRSQNQPVVLRRAHCQMQRERVGRLIFTSLHGFFFSFVFFSIFVR